jgi:hypothetical protein
VISIESKAIKGIDDHINVECKFESSKDATEHELTAIITTVFLKLELSKVQVKTVLLDVLKNYELNRSSFRQSGLEVQA